MISRCILDLCRAEIFDAQDLEYILIDLRSGSFCFFSSCVTLLDEHECADYFLFASLPDQFPSFVLPERLGD